ncbi:hypothetical protein EUGRSUZ_E00094 [Eucalyptus grandis]|uniref:Uncharacterized protein n=2 Tax=Eucalyptus grandis TaxID=71139 RepID=A0ACC3KQN8_EUCGR|nr:hypothetical protein EUGRSUZ_E00094 [Eucalyptus grandis]
MEENMQLHIINSNWSESPERRAKVPNWSKLSGRKKCGLSRRKLSFVHREKSVSFHFIIKRDVTMNLPYR